MKIPMRFFVQKRLSQFYFQRSVRNRKTESADYLGDKTSKSPDTYLIDIYVRMSSGMHGRIVARTM